MIMHKVTTLNQFIIERQAEIPGATGEFSRLLHHIGIAAKKVHREVNKAGLVDILGKVGSINVQGEDQQKLDVYADKTFMDELRASGECCGVATEENQDIVVFEEGLSKDGKYIICMDPLDGSSNFSYRGTACDGRFLPARNGAGGCRLCDLRIIDHVSVYFR